MCEQEESKTSETALLTALGTEEASQGSAFRFGHHASTSVWLSWRKGRGLENVTSEESLLLISLKKKVLRRQHHKSHQTHKSMMWSREAKLTVLAHSGCPAQEPSLPARKGWTTGDLARTRVIRHCRRLHGEALAPPFPTMFKSRPDWRYSWACAQAGVASSPCSPDVFPF